MPLFDFVCADCDRRFEALVRGSRSPGACPSCGGKRLARQLAAPARPVSNPATIPAGGGCVPPPMSGGCCGGGCHIH